MRMILAIFLVGLLAGCATGPQMPIVELKSGDRIGVLVESGNSPSHSHIGTTVFNNFDKRYSYNWDLQTKVTAAVSDSLKRSGFAVVDLAKEGFSYNDVAGLVVHTSDEWRVSARKDSTFRKLKEQLGIKAVVVLKESRVTASLECAGGPCNERYMNASGLYTRSMFGLTNYYAVAAYNWNAFVFDPVADVAKGANVSKVLQRPSSIIRNFTTPANFENITEAEFEPVRGAVMKIVENNASVVAAALKNVNQ